MISQKLWQSSKIPQPFITQSCQFIVLQVPHNDSGHVLLKKGTVLHQTPFKVYVKYSY